jgi:hypothetical protein
MHHAHVKRKEHPMNRYIVDEFYQDPALRRRLFESARRERGRVIRAGLAWVRHHLTARLPSQTGRWIERLG